MTNDLISKNISDRSFQIKLTVSRLYIGIYIINIIEFVVLCETFSSDCAQFYSYEVPIYADALRGYPFTVPTRCNPIALGTNTSTVSVLPQATPAASVSPTAWSSTSQPTPAVATARAGPSCLCCRVGPTTPTRGLQVSASAAT